MPLRLPSLHVRGESDRSPAASALRRLAALAALGLGTMSAQAGGLGAVCDWTGG